MIHAYNEQFLDIIQRKVAAMFELAVLEEHIDHLLSATLLRLLIPSMRWGNRQMNFWR